MRIVVVRGTRCAVSNGHRRFLGRGELVPLGHRVSDELVLFVGNTLVDDREGFVDGRSIRSLLGKALVEGFAFEPFLGGRAALDRESLLREVERSDSEPQDFGRFVIEADGERVGAMGFEVANRRSQIARLERLAVQPAFRGRGIADEAARQFQRHVLLDLGYHRLELEIYAFNDRALAHAERAGFVREGVKRKAYVRHGDRVDAVMFALLREDLAE